MKTAFVILGIVLGSANFIGLYIWGVDSASKNRCVNYGKATDKEVKFVVDWPNVCYVKTSTGWHDRKELRAIN